MIRRFLCCLFLLVLAGGLLGSQCCSASTVSPGRQGAQQAPEDSLQLGPTEPIEAVRIDVNEDAVPDRIGDTVTVAGRATAGRGRLSVPVSGIAALQDSTAGIHILLPDGPPVERGDSLRVRGVVVHKYGLTQLQVSEYKVADAPSSVPDPVPLTATAAAGERYEGRLARIEGYVAQKGSNEGGKYLFISDRARNRDQQDLEDPPRITVFVASGEASRIELGRFEEGSRIAVTGVLGQHDYEAPYRDYHQVTPRGSADLSRVGLWAYVWPAMYVLLGGGGLAVVGTIYGLRAAVRRRTRKLEESKEKLREERDRFEMLFESLPTPVVHGRHEEEGLVVENVNPAFEATFGYRPGDAKGEDLDGLIVPPDEKSEAETLNKKAIEGKAFQVEARRLTKEGPRIFDIRVASRTEGPGPPEGYGIFNDITEQKEREEVLRGRREKVGALYRATRQLLQAKSREEVVTRAHEILGDLLEYPFGHTGLLDEGMIIPKKTTADGDVRLPSPQPRSADGDTVAARAIQAGEPVVVERTNALDNDIDYGDLRSAAAVPVGEHGAFVVGRTEEGGFEQLDLRLLEVLGGYAALVLERLSRVRALQKAKEEAEEAARLKSAMLANMSHEIRTPLTSVIGFAEALGEEAQETDGTVRRFARLIEKSGTRLLETLDGVLNLSKLEAGEMELGSEPVDLADRARKVAEELRPEAKEENLRLQVETSGAPVRAQADAGGMQIVVQNFLSNAIKYTGEGGNVWVRTYREDGQAALEVEDTGIGMDPAQVERFFEPFRQASEGMGREYEGTGLGLAVAKRAAEQMNGEIEVETEKGEGSRFTVRLPRAGDAQTTSSKEEV